MRGATRHICGTYTCIVRSLTIDCATEVALACSRHVRARLWQAGWAPVASGVGYGVQQKHHRRSTSAEFMAVLQGEAEGRRLTADIPGGGRSEGSAVVQSGRHVLLFSNNLRAAHSPVPAPAATVNQAMSYTSGWRRLAGEGPGAAGAGETTAAVTGRRLAGEGPGVRVYDEKAASVVRPVMSVAC